MHGETREEHVRLLLELARRLKKYNMRVNPKKLQFGHQEVQFCRVLIGGMRPWNTRDQII